ncbi:hypothetical protein A3H10_03865 [Candidatus Uhrbacteria bacterium RIFCSPLOWO2_12_FULL_46_10]|uniref:DUF5667 domain-containing protein n=1 Tax=Candidatus Uhrbacteria bacterium RIFCSPLOWO2_01_FULL_47_25 TaxID=1802402 RepID=A0A1F7UTE1_9BACT|nr:MAG: hypothetical protein UX68_C0005G0017 [Parcubacteria group bacterium GW2011_GWA2_46_9]OGL60624.1 MAG: hypothetical protein A2752_02240 [Candidatus Uhrbacteria bacterium RIFCSPHIGHO2_01_FULL_46_23]OGL68137.1 MAG: hypothetical protein A3D60_03995 [Candidatus Uhrbacteria bacterium RIFCSPHIGHO2_02_FULL_47_29]OGL80988.1 MAG: hypothetical protein A2936_03330 [Candidatus Uhrbacteria bacterium RIFCSPLOWO2_01_FULL_47_25]OGL84691.1 MAG: hypothetical protein A3I37_04980 [Candidatus Uhrbacteria bact
MRRQLKKQFRELKAIAPSASWLSAHRELLLAQVRVQSKPRVAAVVPSLKERVRTALFVGESIFTTTASAIYARGLASLVLALVLVVASGGYVVTAAEGSLPGSRLYDVKVAVENLRLNLATSTRARVELQAEFAMRRLDELSKLTARDGQRLPEAETLISQFESSIKDIAAAANEVSSASPERGLEIAKIVDGKVGEYEHALKAAGEAARSSNLSKSVSRALSTVNKAGTEALKVLVGQGPTSEPEKIAGKLNDKIKDAEEKLRLADAKLSAYGRSPEGGEGGAKSSVTSEAKDKSADAKTNLEEAKKKITEGDYQAALVILDKVEDMVEEVADSAETVNSENAEQGTENPEGEVKGESTESKDGTSGQPTSSDSTTEQPASSSQTQ